MSDTISKLFQWLSSGSKRSNCNSQMEQYLSQSTSLEDLERRQRLITYGKAPFQTNYPFYTDIDSKGRAY